MDRVRLTERVRRGLWLICARSPTVMDAEAGPEGWEPGDREAVLLAMRYAIQNFKPRFFDDSRDQNDE